MGRRHGRKQDSRAGRPRRSRPPRAAPAARRNRQSWRSKPRSRLGGTSFVLAQSQQEHGRPCVEATLPTARGDGASVRMPWDHNAMTRRARAFIRSSSCRRRARIGALRSIRPVLPIKSGCASPRRPSHRTMPAQNQCRQRFRSGQLSPCVLCVPIGQDRAPCHARALLASTGSLGSPCAALQPVPSPVPPIFLCDAAPSRLALRGHAREGNANQGEKT